MLRALAECVGACTVGLFIMFFAFSVNDAELGRILLYSGMIVGYSGMLWALASAFRKGQERGDW